MIHMRVQVDVPQCKGNCMAHGIFRCQVPPARARPRFFLQGVADPSSGARQLPSDRIKPSYPTQLKPTFTLQSGER